MYFVLFNSTGSNHKHKSGSLRVLLKYVYNFSEQRFAQVIVILSIIKI